jgi:hypothetical protein
MTRNERIAWAKDATPEQWAEALAVGVMGWRKAIYDRWFDVDDKFVFGGCFDPAKLIQDAWLVHRKMADGNLHRRGTYFVELTEAIRNRQCQETLGTWRTALDMTPRDICLAALLVADEASERRVSE